MKFFPFLLLLLIGTIPGSAQIDFANTRKYAEENERLPAPRKSEKRIVFMGDSIFESWKKLDSGFFANPLFIDRGISGQTSQQMLLRFRQDVIGLKPYKVIILAGTNDIAENNGPLSTEYIFGNIVSMCELAKANGIKPVICSVLPVYKYKWRPALEPADRIIELNHMLREYAKHNKLAFVDVHTIMADEKKGMKESYSKDGVHPNLEGYRLMEKVLRDMKILP